MPKVVFITGGSSGIGKAIGEFLLTKECIVYGTSRHPENYSSTTKFPLVALDVTKPETITEAFKQVIDKEGKIDVVVNNAGVGITGPIEETPTNEMRKAFDTNFFGPLEVIKAVLPQLRKQKSGHIINVTSIAAYMGLPYRGIYSASKAALEITIEAYRMETLQFGVHMTNIAPGDFATNIAAGRYHAPILEGSPYEKDYGETLKTMNDHVQSGGDPLEMAKAVYKIIQTNKPAVRYREGAFIQRFSIVLKKILPSKTYEKMLMKHYHLDK
ncbi:SDR family oxidoreductase [Jejudonia soesokkakensis]|uniref:SDR family oxidoreductase n=1 Tax=Jejudonia soesokkakensis TaxID=1323432 RepID=A0ABW2MTJ0_9FLAO